MFRRYAIPAAGVAALVFLVWAIRYFLTMPGKEEIVNYPSSGTTIVAFGDSLVAGLGSERGGGFAAFLSEKLAAEPVSGVKSEVVNLGGSGDTTEDALGRVEQIFAHDPKVVIILLGGNDFLRRIPKETAFRNLDEIVARIQERGAIVLLLGVKGAIFGDNAEEYYAELAERRGAAYIPNILDGIFGRAELMYDGIHPNDAGYEKIAERIYFALRELIE